MRPRCLAPLAVITLAVMAGSFGAGAARAASGASDASGGSKASTICVALVVDGRALGSDVTTSCAKVRKGATGTDVLEAAGHTIGYRHDGLICTIDGLPKAGCAGIDDSHYWAYYHRSPGSTKWIYSSEGAGSYEPVNASTEGWVYDNGTANPPENVPYDQICKPSATPSPTPTHTATQKPHPVTAPKPARSHHPAAPSQTATATATPSASASKKPHHHHAAATTTPEPSASTPTAAITATSAALAGAVPAAKNGHGTTGLVIGVIVVAGLAILAFARFRRSLR